MQDPRVRTDSYRRDKNHVIAWIAATAGGLLVGWGVWITADMYAVKASNLLEDEQIKTNDAQSRERDKSIAEAAAERAAQIQVQLAQIQTQLAEIQRELRRGGHP